MEIIGQIIGFIFAGFLLLLAYKLFAKDRFPSATFVAGTGAFILLCSFPFFQGWAKSFIASQIMSKFEALGTQVNTIQATTATMLNDLSNQVNYLKQTNALMHTELENHQFVITIHQTEIDKNQTALGTAQTNLLVQETKLNDVEYWIKNVFDNKTTEFFTHGDTNGVVFVPTNEGKIIYMIRLAHVPIYGSLEITMVDAASKYPMRVNITQDFIKNNSSNKFRNVIYGVGTGFDTNSLVFTVNYVMDTRDTKVTQYMPIVNQDLFFSPDGSITSFPKP